MLQQAATLEVILQDDSRPPINPSVMHNRAFIKVTDSTMGMLERPFPRTEASLPGSRATSVPRTPRLLLILPLTLRIWATGFASR